jgi:hypothetical protein
MRESEARKWKNVVFECVPRRFSIKMKCRPEESGMNDTESVPTSQPRHLEITANDLAAHVGNWVAFSPDGRSIIASCRTLQALEEQVAAAGHDLEEVLLDRITSGAGVRSGSELS